MLDAELLGSVDSQYYCDDDDFDAGHFAFQSAVESESFGVEHIDKERKQLEKQLQAINRKMSELILHKQPEYTEQLKQVGVLEGQLGDAFEIGKHAQICVKRVRNELQDDYLSLVAASRKKQRLEQLLESIDTIKTLRRTEDRLKELVEVSRA